MTKNIRFYTIAVLFDKLPTPKVNRCLHMDIRYSTFDMGSHVMSCLRESVEFVIFFLFLQLQLLQIHLSPANLTTAIQFTLASHKQISTNFNAFKTHYKHFKISTHHINTKKTTLASNQTKNRVQTLSSHIQNTCKSTTYISLQ